MNSKKTLGIWMDHAIANLIEDTDLRKSHHIESTFTHTQKVDALQRSENLMHNKEQQLQEAYYQEIADQIVKYDHVLLFGPTNARVELHNYLNKDLHFKDITIDTEAAEQMTVNEQFVFVKRHFEE
ncbi:MAG: hypothetical protein NWR72_20030 [Bacteroidia bacterium]|nr:hypothetical protein [Bacteroidia bacterium]